MRKPFPRISCFYFVLIPFLLWALSLSLSPSHTHTTLAFLHLLLFKRINSNITPKKKGSEQRNLFGEKGKTTAAAQ